MRWKMHLELALVLLLVLQRTTSQSDFGYIRIDCGDDLNDNFINPDCGYGRKINASIEDDPMNTLRVFPDMNKSCYTMPTFIDQTYLVRVGFYYGNYDGLSKPPIFDLQLDANSWTKVLFNSANEPVFHEAVIVARKKNINVCVARTQEGSIPFMSLLELMELLPGMYAIMDGDFALFKQYRLNFGANRTIGYPDDRYGRIWDPAPTTGYTNVTADFDSLILTSPDDPPLLAMTTAIESASTSDPIHLTLRSLQLEKPSYIVLYFSEPTKLKPGQTRAFNVLYRGGQLANTKVSPVYRACSEVSMIAYDGPFHDVILNATTDSSLPPVLSAAEFYTMSESLVEGTLQKDIKGLHQLARFSSSLLRWSGDPCLPVAWDWLRCNEDKSPRVNALYLANYDLKSLPDFTDLEALEIIDLQNNSLFGNVPYFLGNFPHLKELNLADNNFNGTVPWSLVNKKISLNISGNPNLKFPEFPTGIEDQTGLIAGLVIGVGAFVFAGFVLVMFILRRTSGQRKVAAVELDTVQ